MSLQKYILAFALLAVISQVCSAACDNKLLTIYGITAVTNGPAVATGAKYCKSLLTKPSCCSADTMNGFQTQSDALIKRLTTSVAARDTSLVKARTTTIPALNTKLSAMTQASTNAATALAKAIKEKPSATNSALLASVQAYGLMSSSIASSLGVLRKSLMGYQNNRKTCIEEIVKIQAAAWCLACNPDLTTQGVDANGAITFSTSLKESLTDSCYNYFSGAAEQSAIFSMTALSSSLDALTAAMTKIANGEATGADDFATAVKNAATSSDDNSVPATLPTGCTKDTCDWIATTLFAGGKIDETSLVRGGSVTASKSSGSGSGDNKRMLADAGWNPDSDEAGTSVTFEQNPGKVDNSSAGLFKSVFGGLLVLLAVLLI